MALGRVENHRAVSLGTVRWLPDALSAPGPITANTVNAKPWPRMCKTDLELPVRPVEACILLLTDIARIQRQKYAKMKHLIVLSLFGLVFLTNLQVSNLLHCIITLRSKPSGAVCCYRSCLYVCNGRAGGVCLWVCYHDNSKLRASNLTKLGL